MKLTLDLSETGALHAGLGRLTHEWSDAAWLQEAIGEAEADVAAGRVREYRPGDVMAHFQRLARPAEE